MTYELTFFDEDTPANQPKRLLFDMEPDESEWQLLPRLTRFFEERPILVVGLKQIDATIIKI